MVSVEHSPDGNWDVVPDSALDFDVCLNDVCHHMKYVRNAYWFTHERVSSNARVYYGDIYDPPEALGDFDYAILCAVLLHVRQPLRVVEGCARLADNLVITDAHYPDVPDDQQYMGWFSTKDRPAPQRLVEI